MSAVQSSDRESESVCGKLVKILQNPNNDLPNEEKNQ